MEAGFDVNFVGLLLGIMGRCSSWLCFFNVFFEEKYISQIVHRNSLINLFSFDISD